MSELVDTERMRVIVFTVHTHAFALPMKAVLKISPRPTQLHQGFDDVGLIELDGQTVRLLVLEQLWAVDPLPEHPFLILVQGGSDWIVGIQVAELPNMMELDRAAIQAIPAAARQTPLGSLCHYVALWHGENETPQPIFLLDLALTLKTHHPPS